MSSHPEDVPASCNDFSAFFNLWLSRQQAFLHQLDTNGKGKDSDRNNKVRLIQQVYSHYQEFYSEKSRVIHQDIFQLFTHPWLTSLERAFLWIGGLFRPSLLLDLTANSISNMLSDQQDKLATLKDEVAWMERKLIDAHAEVQESLGSPTLTCLIKNWRRLVDGEVSDFDEAIKLLKDSMVKVVNEADNLRQFAVVKVGEILSPDQTIEFLAVIARHQLRVRSLGLQYDLIKSGDQ